LANNTQLARRNDSKRAIGINPQQKPMFQTVQIGCVSGFAPNTYAELIKSVDPICLDTI